MIISRCYLTFYATSGSSIKSQVLDLKTLPIFSPLKISVNKTKRSYTQLDSRKRVIAFQDRVTIIHKGSSTLPKMGKINNRQIQYNVENFDEIYVLSASVRSWFSQ